MVVDAVAARSPADAESDIASSVDFLLGLGVKVGSIGPTVIWLVVQVDGLHSSGVN